MLFKSTGESLATLDVAIVDLFGGTAEIYKAGAAETLVKRGGSTGVASAVSFPVGILKEISFACARTKLKTDDILLLLSDGATACGTEWIRRELENFTEGKAQNLAERIAESARRRRTDGHDDDITVMALVCEKSLY